MPVLITLVDNTIPVAADFNTNYTNLNNAIGSSTSITTYVTGDIIYASAANTLARLAIGTAGQVLNVTAGLPSWGGGAGQTVFHLSPVSATFPTTNFPQLDKTVGTNHTAYTLRYDQTTQETAYWTVGIPTGAPGFTGASIEIFWRSTATTGSTVWETVSLSRADGEQWDTAGVTNTAAADATGGTAGFVNRTNFTMTVTGWAVGELLQVAIRRAPADAGDDMAADAYLMHAVLRLT